MNKIIAVEGLFKSYGKKKVVENVNFELEAGKFITIIGCNGAGKSTTLRLLAGVEKPDKGEVTVLGKDPFAYEYPHRADVFFIHENYQLAFKKNLLEMVKIYKEVFPSFKGTIFNQIMKDRKISLKKDFKDLSRGQKMQFLLMLALAARPKILLLDEITAVIDIEGQRYFLDKLKEYVSAGGTVLITTNILSELNDYTDHLLLLQETKVMINEPVSALQEKFVMLRKTNEHSIFSHPKVARIRKDHEGKELFLAPKEVLEGDPSSLEFKIEHPVRLEDILMLHFQLKQDQVEDEMVA
jgi:ABC-2 type transport system ATP-binding protein